MGNRPMTGRLQKGGALLPDMRLLVTHWSEELSIENSTAQVASILGKKTLARAHDVYAEAFRPRFIKGSPANAWKLARTLEDIHTDIAILRPFYYWITARAEAALYDFVIEEIMPRSSSGQSYTSVDDAVAWLQKKIDEAKRQWTPTVTRKVGQGMLAALRDFGILEGTGRKHIAPVHIPLEAFSLIAFILNSEGISGHRLVQHQDWKLFLLYERNVERILLECHQHGWLGFYAAGAIYRTEFREISFTEYAHVVLNR
jgi:hypothetical protein